MSGDLVNIGIGNGFSSVGAELLPDPLLTKLNLDEKLRYKSHQNTQFSFRSAFEKVDPKISAILFMPFFSDCMVSSRHRC